MLNGVLFVSPSSADGALIAESLRVAGISVRHAYTLESARELLERETFGAILTESRLPDGDWQDMIALVRSTGRRSAVVVADRLANASLWADVLDLDGYDLIATPYCPQEVQRILANALREPSCLVRTPAPIEPSARDRRISAAA